MSASAISFPGSNVLLSNAPSAVPAGYATLGLQNYGASASASSSSASNAASPAGVNQYQRAYDNIETAVNAYLQNSLLNGPPATLPEFAGGSTAGSFAQLNTLLAQLKNGLGQGLFTGSGFNALA